MNEIVLRLGLVSFFNDISTEMLYPLTPIFLTTVLGASMTSVGLIEGFSEAIASLLKTYAGQISDRLQKRRIFVICGYSLSAISRPLIGLARQWPLVLFARALDRTGKGIRTAPRDALLAESVLAKDRGRAFGWHRGFDTLGAIAGPLVALALLNLSGDQLRPVYFWSFVPGLIAVVFIFSVRERSVPVLVKSPQDEIKLKLSELPKPYLQYVFAWGVFSAVNSSDAFLLLKMKSTGLELRTVILLYVFYNFFYAVTSPWLGGLSDKIGRKKIMLSGLVLFAFVYFGFSLAQNIPQFAGLLAVYGIFMGATDGVGKAWAVDLLPDATKATGLGFLGTVTGLCSLVASVAAGMLWDHFGASGPFLYGGVGALVSFGLLLLSRHHIKSL